MNRARIAFRVDGSATIGVGHVRRCLALAHALRSLGADLAFVTRKLGVNTAAMIRSEGYEVFGLDAPSAEDVPEPSAPKHASWGGVPQFRDASETVDVLRAFHPAWIIIDHYAFDARWHKRVAADLNARICVIDDLADRALAADLLVDHNYSEDHRAKYGAFASSVPRLIGGARFALLGPEYAEAPRYEFNADVRSIGIFMGGGDIGNFSTLALEACRRYAEFSAPIEIVTTRANPWHDSLIAMASQWPDVRTTSDLPTLAPFFARHDLHIGAGGGAAWERCCIGVPSIALICADNQRGVIAGLAGLGVIQTVPENTAEAIGLVVASVAADPMLRERLADRSRVLVDGGGAIRVALSILADSITLRPAMENEARHIHSWRNDTRTRRYFRDSSPVSVEEHLRWWSATLLNKNRRLLIAHCGSRDVGVLRLDLEDESAEVSLYVDPELTGLGLGPAVIRAIQRWVQEHEPRILSLTAHVLPQNSASTKAFCSGGFRQMNATEWTWSR